MPLSQDDQRAQSVTGHVDIVGIHDHSPSQAGVAMQEAPWEKPRVEAVLNCS
jgi:hypothetical protein